MKVAFRLESDFFTNDELNDYWNKPIYFDWDYEVLPHRKDLIDLENILNDDLLTDDIMDLSWDVEYIRWERFNGLIVPVFYLEGT